MAILSGCVFDPFVSIWRNQSLPLEHRYILIAWCVCTWYHVTGRVSCRTHILSLVYKVYWYYSCGTKFSTTTAAIPGLQVTNLVAGTGAATYGARVVNLVANFKENQFLPRNNILP